MNITGWQRKKNHLANESKFYSLLIIKPRAYASFPLVAPGPSGCLGFPGSSGLYPPRAMAPNRDDCLANQLKPFDQQFEKGCLPLLQIAFLIQSRPFLQIYTVDQILSPTAPVHIVNNVFVSDERNKLQQLEDAQE